MLYVDRISSYNFFHFSIIIALFFFDFQDYSWNFRNFITIDSFSLFSTYSLRLTLFLSSSSSFVCSLIFRSSSIASVGKSVEIVFFTLFTIECDIRWSCHHAHTTFITFWWFLWFPFHRPSQQQTTYTLTHILFIFFIRFSMIFHNFLTSQFFKSLCCAYISTWLENG